MMGGTVDTPRSGGQPSPIESLVQMGFERQLVINALEASANDFDRALQLLIDQREYEERNRRASAAERRASQTAVYRPNAPRTASYQSTVPPPIRTTTVSVTGSSVAVSSVAATGTNFTDLALLFAGRAQAVDTLSYVLNTIWDNPNEAKYRAVKTTNARFRETLGSDPRTKQNVETFMAKLGFERAGEWLTLPPNYNRSLLKSAIDALANVQSTSSAYLSAKRVLEFEKAIELSKQSANEEEQARRAFYAANVPPVPAEGAAGTTRISIIISEGSPPLMRRFVADDTLGDVINWIGSERSIVCQKILDGSWSLVDETLLEKRTFDVKGGDVRKTLHALQLWPSATLHVRLSRSQ